jgi:hypothetical protein
VCCSRWRSACESVFCNGIQSLIYPAASCIVIDIQLNDNRRPSGTTWRDRDWGRWGRLTVMSRIPGEEAEDGRVLCVTETPIVIRR